jgi:spermidine synthase
LITSGVFRYLYGDKPKKIWVRDGKTATISVAKNKDDDISISTNGKVDASLEVNDLFSGDNVTQAGLAFYSIALKNEPYTTAVIGLGSGMTAQYLLCDPLVKKLDLIEIEEEMYYLSTHFKPYNNRIFTDPRFHIFFQDARTYFASKKETYDIIVSEPSNPWVSGVSSLFTKEFYAQLKYVLKKDGILVQWIHLYEFNNELLMSIFKAINENFTYFQVYTIDENNNICILISDTEIELCGLDRMSHTPSIRSEFEKLGIPPDRFSDKYYNFSHVSLAGLFKNYRVNSDFFPVVDNLSEQAFYKNQFADLLTIFSGDISFYQEFYENPGYAEIIKRTSTVFLEKEYDSTEVSMSYLFHSVKNPDFAVHDWSKFITDFIELYPFTIWPAINGSIPSLDSLCIFIENNADDVPEKYSLLFHYYLLKKETEKFNFYMRHIITNTKNDKLSYPFSKNLFIAALKLKDIKSANTVYIKFLKRFLEKHYEEELIIKELLKSHQQATSSESSFSFK